MYQIIDVATVLTVYGIETLLLSATAVAIASLTVATVLTVYGIETSDYIFESFIDINRLQQYLPFTVLKLIESIYYIPSLIKLQQYLPFTVLKRSGIRTCNKQYYKVATVLTVYGIETLKNSLLYRIQD